MHLAVLRGLFLPPSLARLVHSLLPGEVHTFQAALWGSLENTVQELLPHPIQGGGVPLELGLAWEELQGSPWGGCP